MIYEVLCDIGKLNLFLMVICFMLINLWMLMYIRVWIDDRRESVIRNELILYRIIGIF